MDGRYFCWLNLSELTSEDKITFLELTDEERTQLLDELIIEDLKDAKNKKEKK